MGIGETFTVITEILIIQTYYQDFIGTRTIALS